MLAKLSKISKYDIHLVRLEAGVRKCEGRGKVREQPTEAMEFFSIKSIWIGGYECMVKMKEERNKGREGRKRMKVVSRGKRCRRFTFSSMKQQA